MTDTATAMSEAEKEKIKHFAGFTNIVAAGAIVAGSLVPILNVWYSFLRDDLNGAEGIDAVTAVVDITLYLTGFVICMLVQLLGGLRLGALDD